MLKKILLPIVSVAMATTVIFSIAQADTINSLSPFQIHNNIIAPIVTSSSFQIPSLGSAGNPCTTVNASGTFATSTCGSGGSGSSTLIYASSGISATASGTNGYIIGNTGVTSFNGATGTVIAAPFYYVAASNATTSEKNIAQFVCTGTNDATCINNALLAASSTGACVVLSDGTFNTGAAEIFYNRQGGCLRGSGMFATQVIGTSATATIQIGNRQAGTAMYSQEWLSDMSVYDTNPSSTQTVWIDGMGNNGVLQNLNVQNQDGGNHALTLEDIDRDAMTNIYVQGGQISPLFSEVGLENTWSNFDATHVVIVPETVGNVSSTDWLWGTDPDQSGNAGFSRVDLTNVHYFCPSSITPGSTGLRFANNGGAVTFQQNIALFENCDLGVVAPWEDDITDNQTSYLMDSGTSTADIEVSHYANMTFNGDNFQQTTNVFYNPVGGQYPNITLNGNNKNQGNITNIFNGSFGLLNGQDTVFAGDNKLSLGNSSQRMANVYTVNLNATGTITTGIAPNSFVATDGSGNLIATGTPAGGGGVATTTTYSTGYLQEASSSGAITNSPVYSGSATTISIGTTTVNGIVNVVNASNTTALGISATTGATSSAVTLNVLGNASTSPTAPVNIFQILSDGHINATGTRPTMGTCGSSPSVIGSDAAGTITVGSGVVTSCTINWQVPYETTNYRCLATDNSAAISSAVTAQTTSTATFGLSATLGGGNIFYMCSETL